MALEGAGGRKCNRLRPPSPEHRKRATSPAADWPADSSPWGQPRAGPRRARKAWQVSPSALAGPPERTQIGPSSRQLEANGRSARRVRREEKGEPARLACFLGCRRRGPMRRCLDGFGSAWRTAAFARAAPARAPAYKSNVSTRSPNLWNPAPFCPPLWPPCPPREPPSPVSDLRPRATMVSPVTGKYDWILAITTIAFIFSAFGNGANDVANSYASASPPCVLPL